MITSKWMTTLTLIGLMIMLGLSPQAFAGFEPPDTSNEEIVGPTMWGVGVIDCPNGTGPCVATMRVKMVDDCVVSTNVVDESALVVPNLPNAPTGPESVLHIRFNEGAFFNLPCTAIITKVKNWWPQTSGAELYSFDAQIKYVVVKDSATECTVP